MLRNFITNKCILVVFTFIFICLIAFTNGCKKQDQPESAQQTVSTNDFIDTDTVQEQVEDVEDIDISEKINLRILYAGLLGTERAKDFTDFLSKHFKEVRTTDYMSFTGNEPTVFDVAIIDHNGLGFNTPLPKISRQYSRATVTMGVPGGFISGRLNLKTDYL